MKIPHGKHKGKLLSQLTDAELAGIRNGWNGTPRLKASPFFSQIEQHVAYRKHGRMTPTLGTEAKTDRGFPVVIFEDSHGKPCSLQQSSVIGNYEDAYMKPGTSAVWLGVDEEKRMHMNREQVAGLIERLSMWLETGSIHVVDPVAHSRIDGDVEM